MKEIRIMMDMPIIVEIVDKEADQKTISMVFDYFNYIDKTFSTFKKTSEVSRINRGELSMNNACDDVKTIFTLSEKTKTETNGYFDIKKNGYYDPSGIVKGWAIYQTAKQLQSKGFKNFYIDAGGDIYAAGHNGNNQPWRVGIRNPFNRKENIKVLEIVDRGVATSGTYIRGQHIYDPFYPEEKISDIVSLTVISLNVYEADRFATAAFAMGKKGIGFIEKLTGFEGYMVDKNGIATYKSGFNNYVIKDGKTN